MTALTSVPNPIDLTWVAAVKNRAEVNSSNDDSAIQDAITGFSQWLLHMTGQGSLNSIASYDEIYDGNGNMRMFLRNYPIQTVIAVTINGQAVSMSSNFNSWGVFIDQSKKSIALRPNLSTYGTSSGFPYYNAFPGSNGQRVYGPQFLRGLGNIEVQYTAGFPPVSINNDVETIASQTVPLAFGPWVADLGVVFYPTLIPLLNVPSAPAAGQYAVSNGLYVFNATDNAKQVALSYTINRAPYDLEYAVRCVVAINYKRKAWQDQGSRSTNQAGSSSTTSYRNWTWPPEYQQIFEHYQRKAIIT